MSSYYHNTRTGAVKLCVSAYKSSQQQKTRHAQDLIIPFGGGEHTNVRRGPFLIRVAGIYSGGASLRKCTFLFFPKKDDNLLVLVTFKPILH